MPPSAAIGASATVDFAQQFIEKRFAFEKTKIIAQFRNVQRSTPGTKQRANIFEILRSLWIVDQRLQLESDQSFGADDVQLAQRALHARRIGEKPQRDWTVRVK